MAMKTQPFGQNIVEAINGIRLDETKVNEAYDHSQTIGNPHQTTKADVGLGNVDNTSDADKPISTATQNALNSKVDKVSGKSLIADSEIERLASVHNYDDTEIREEIESKADKSEVELVSTSTTSPILDSANGNIRDFEAFGKCEQKSLNGNNLFDFSTINTVNSVGLTIEKVYDSDGNFDGIKIVGTPTATSYLKFGESTAPAFEKEGIFTISGYGKLNAYFRYDDGTYSNSSNSLTSNGKKIVAFNLLFAKGSAYDEIIRPIINSGSSILPYEPYVGGISSPNPSYPQEIKAWNGIIKTHGKNLLNCSGLAQQTINGVTFTPHYVNGELEYINVNGTATADALYLIKSLFETTSNCVLNGCPVGGGNGTYDLRFASNYRDVGAGRNVESGVSGFVAILVRANNTLNNTKFYPMIRLAEDTDSSYVPYHTSEADLGISLYGIKVASGGNYTDENGQQWLCDKIDMKNCGVDRVFGNVDLGTLTWIASSSLPNCFYANVSDGLKRTSNILCDSYQYGGNEYTEKKICVSSNADISTMRLLIKNSDYADVNSFKASLNGVNCLYQLATTTTEPLTDAQINALRGVQTYSDSTYVEYGVLEPFAEIGYWLGNKNGQVLAELDAKINQLLIN